VSNTAVVKALARFNPFNDLDAQYHERIAGHAEILSIGKGKIVFKRGREATHRYYLLEGTVDLVDSGFNTRSVSATDSSNTFTLEDSSPTQVSAVAKSSSKLLKVDAEFLDISLAWSQSHGTAAIPDDLGQPKAPEDIIPEVSLSIAQVEVNEDDSDWMSTLLKSPLFFRVSAAHIQNLFMRFQSMPVKAGDVIIKEGKKGDYFYVIDHGTVHVTSLTGKVDVELNKGQFFGEEALVGDTPRNASITMRTDGTLMRLNKDDFVSLLQEPVQKFLTYAELTDRKESSYQLLDVRLAMEFRHKQIENSKNIPLLNLRDKVAEFNDKKIYVIADNAGRRSQVAAYLLCQKGFEAYILEGSDQHY
jgi:CRP-like cAMP-binding protein